MSGVVPYTSTHMPICLQDVNKEDSTFCRPWSETICTSSLLAQVPRDRPHSSALLSL